MDSKEEKQRVYAKEKNSYNSFQKENKTFYYQYIPDHIFDTFLKIIFNSFCKRKVALPINLAHCACYDKKIQYKENKF